ncbi:MAG: asparagine synthase (glutamine-hydrolyzing) [Fibrobacteres bacterium]|nr:asparagine synthase (glutamine-hydrolyzing) [Fibrobacterota bacterium]
MCGIAGTLAFASGSFRVTEGHLTPMRDAMMHRGPDGGANWIAPDGKVGLAHRRLSIIDLSTVANQPMCNEDGSIWVAFNGEIYNHADIRKELMALGGHRWKTDHSDTEVILHAFEQWGIDCLHRFRGMFAFALWDGRSRDLWLVRDRIGIKPLYYSIHHGRLNFASEIKALLKDPGQPRALNEASYFHFLSFLTAPAPETFFEGIRKLPPGTWLRVREDGSIREERYWDVWDHAKPLTGVPVEEIRRRLLDELREAVKLRKVSDVPVGVFLSGGVDSSTNAALFSEGEGGIVKTFTIGYQGDNKSYGNETEFARIMAAKVGAEYHERLLKVEDLIDFLPTMVHLQDEPIADPVCVPLYYVCKLARDNGVIVCQLGEGADELFWGYPYWKRMLGLQRLDDLPVPRVLKRLGVSALGLAGKGRTDYTEWLRRGAEGVPVFWGGADAFTHAGKQSVLSPRLRAKFAGRTSWEALQPILDRFLAKAWDTSHLNWMSYLDLNMRLPELLLMRVDKMSMGVSLEGRVPFLDHKFVEFAMGIPPGLKTAGGELKTLLKSSVRGLVPDELIYRKKRGFGIPMHEWVMQRLGKTMRDELEAFCKRVDLIDFRAVEGYLARSEGYPLWYLYNFALWHRHFIEGV